MTELNEEDKQIMSEFRELKHQENQLKDKMKELEPYVKEIMEDFDLKNIQHGDLKVSYVPESTSQTFDTTRFKKEHPDIVSEYQKESVRKSHIRTKLG